MTFANRIITLRKERNLAVKELALKAQVPATLISGLQSGQRTIGENNARKIGIALQLAENELEDFVYLALNEAVGRVLECHRAYPAEVLNLVAGELRAAGIAPADINGCELLPKSEENTSKAEIYLENGKSDLITVKIARRG